MSTNLETIIESVRVLHKTFPSKNANLNNEFIAMNKCFSNLQKVNTERLKLKDAKQTSESLKLKGKCDLLFRSTVECVLTVLLILSIDQPKISYIKELIENTKKIQNKFTEHSLLNRRLSPDAKTEIELTMDALLALQKKYASKNEDLEDKIIAIFGNYYQCLIVQNKLSELTNKKLSERLEHKGKYDLILALINEQIQTVLLVLHKSRPEDEFIQRLVNLTMKMKKTIEDYESTMNFSST